MLGSLFPGIGGDDRGSDRLSSGANPKLIQGNDAEVLRKHASLPYSVDREQVIRSASDSGKASAAALLLAKYSRNTLATANAALQMYQTRTNHSAQALRLEEQWQKATGRHHQTIAKFDLGTAENEAQLSGFEAELQHATSILGF